MYLFREFTLINKELCVSLQSIYGVGWLKAINILSKVGVSYPFFLQNLNMYNFFLILFLLKGFLISDVRIKRRVEFCITKLKEVKSYRGVRHIMTLPVHGQRTRTNANTQRSKRVRQDIYNQFKKS